MRIKLDENHAIGRFGHQKAKAPRSLGALEILNDACQLIVTACLTVSSMKMQVRVTSEGEGIEP
jgi:hypothetical protein